MPAGASNINPAISSENLLVYNEAKQPPIECPKIIYFVSCNPKCTIKSRSCFR